MRRSNFVFPVLAVVIIATIQPASTGLLVHVEVARETISKNSRLWLYTWELGRDRDPCNLPVRYIYSPAAPVRSVMN